MREDLEDAVDWKPELGPEDLSYAQELREQIGPRIQLFARVRSALGLTQNDAATALGMTQGGLSKQERAHPKAVASLAALARSRGARLRFGIELADGSYLDLSDEVELLDPAPVLGG